METMIQPKVTGYRQLSEDEVALMNEGMCAMSDAQMAIRAAEQAEGMRNAYPEMISSEMLAQASMNFWRQEGPFFTPAPIQMPPPTMWERIRRWLLA